MLQPVARWQVLSSTGTKYSRLMWNNFPHDKDKKLSCRGVLLYEVSTDIVPRISSDGDKVLPVWPHWKHARLPEDHLKLIPNFQSKSALSKSFKLGTLTSQPVNLAHQHWRTWLSLEQRIPLTLFTVPDSIRKSEAQLAGTLLEHSRDSQKYPFLSSEVEINFVYRYPFLSLFWLFSYIEKISYIKSCGCYSFFYFLWKLSDFLEL